MKIKPLFAWYDFWIGGYWDCTNRRLYLLPLPCIGVVLQFRRPEVVEIYRGLTYYPDDRTGAGACCNTVITLTTDRTPTAYVNKTRRIAS